MCDHYSLDLGVVMQKGQVCSYPEKQSPRPTHFRGRFPFQRRRPVRSPICRAHSAPARGISQIPQLLRVESLVTRCSNNAGNSREISKGEFQNDICRFESSQPSQAVGLCRCGPCLPTSITGRRKTVTCRRAIPAAMTVEDIEEAILRLPPAPAARCCYAVRRFCCNGSIQC